MTTKLQMLTLRVKELEEWKKIIDDEVHERLKQLIRDFNGLSSIVIKQAELINRLLGLVEKLERMVADGSRQCIDKDEQHTT